LLYLKKIITGRVKISKLSALLSVDAVLAISTFVTGLVYLNLMQKEALAEFTYISTIMNHASILLSMGTYVVLIKNYGSSKSRKKKILETRRIFGLLIAVALLLIIFSCLAMSEFKDLAQKNNINITEFELKYIIAVAAVILGIFNLNLYSFSIAIKSVKGINYIKIIRFIASAVVTLLVLSNIKEPDHQVIGRLLSILVGELVILILFSKMIFIIFRAGGGIKLPQKKDFRLFAYLTLISVFNFFQQTIEKTFLLSRGDMNALAEYNVALLFLSAIPMIVTAIQNIWISDFYSQKNKLMAKAEIINICRTSATILLSAGFLIMLVAQSMLAVGLLPSSYSDLSLDICLLLPTVIITALMQYIYNIFMYLEKPKYQLYANIINAIILYLLSAVMIPEFGKYGAMISVFLSVSITMAFAWYIVYNETKGIIEND